MQVVAMRSSFIATIEHGRSTDPVGRGDSATTRVQAIMPYPCTARCLSSGPRYWDVKRLLHHATVPTSLSVEGKMLRYSLHLSEVVLLHDRRSHTSLGAHDRPLLYRIWLSCLHRQFNIPAFCW